MIISTFTYEIIDSKMYVVIEGNAAIVIDPCSSRASLEMLNRHGVETVDIILTHEHYDHMSGIGFFKEHYKECSVICSKECNKYLQIPSRNGSKFFRALFLEKDSDLLKEAGEIEPVSYIADVVFEKEKNIEWRGHNIVIIETPGHSPGSVCIIIDESIIFTGDSLLKNTSVVTKLPGGSSFDYNNRTVPFLKKLNNKTKVYPGHGEGGLLEEFDIAEV